MASRSVKHLGSGNIRNATTYTVDGVTDTLSGWAARIGCTYHALYKRICLQGRSAEEAIKAGSRNLNRTYITIGNDTHTIAEWARKTGVDADIISQRIVRGWCVEEAVGLRAHEFRCAAKTSFRGKTRRICEWARELGINYETMRHRLLRQKDGLMSSRAVFMKGRLDPWRIMRKVKHQNWYRGKRLRIADICALKGCGRSWVSHKFAEGFSATQILDNPALVPCVDSAEMARRSAESQRRNKRLRELKRMGLVM